MSLMQRIKKYPPLLFFLAAGRRVQRLCSILFWTAYAKVLLCLLGCSYGRGLTVDGHVWIRVREKGAIKLGDGVAINSRFGSNLVGLNTPTVFECLEGGRIEVGAHSGLSGVVLSSRAGIYIGEYVQIGGNVRIFDHDYHSTDYRIRLDPYEDMKRCARAEVHIGSNVFLGTNSMILKGVTIGDRSIVAAGSVVTKSIPSDEIWGGNPARHLKTLKRNEDANDSSRA